MYTEDYKQHQKELARFKEITISLESNMFSDMVGQMSGLLSDIGNVLSNKLKDINYYINGLPEDPKVFFEQLNYLESKLDKINYVDIKDKIVPIPQGFKGEYISYIEALLPIIKETKEHIKEVLVDYTTLVSSIINNGSDKIILKDYNELYKKIQDSRVKIDNEYKKFFSGNQAIAKVGELIASMSQLKELNKKLEVLILTVDKQELTSMNESVNNVHNLLNILISSIKENKIVVNKADTIDLSNGAYELASYLESVAMTYYSINEIINRVKDLIVTVMK